MSTASDRVSNKLLSRGRDRVCRGLYSHDFGQQCLSASMFVLTKVTTKIQLSPITHHRSKYESSGYNQHHSRTLRGICSL